MLLIHPEVVSVVNIQELSLIVYELKIGCWTGEMLVNYLEVVLVVLCPECTEQLSLLPGLPSLSCPP